MSDEMEDLDALDEALAHSHGPGVPMQVPGGLVRGRRRRGTMDPEGPFALTEGTPLDSEIKRTFVHWNSSDGKTYFPAAKVQDVLAPGMYEIEGHPEQGIFFVKVTPSEEELVSFEDSNVDRVLAEIKDFWDKEERYKRYKLPHKRGLLMWGSQGTGKTCTIDLAMEDVIEREGIVIKFGIPALFVQGFRIFREIQPNTPVVVVMEDLDEAVQLHSESQITNILDGAESMNKVVFLATTNYPGDLGARIVNRPSRFDRVFRVGNLGEKNRRTYIEFLLKKGDLTAEDAGIDMEVWVKDTEEMPISHIQELFKSVVIHDNEYKHVIRRLQRMKDTIDGRMHGGPAGFQMLNQGQEFGEEYE